MVDFHSNDYIAFLRMFLNKLNEMGQSDNDKIKIEIFSPLGN